MEPKNERESAAGSESNSDANDGDNEPSSVTLPPVGELPQPPVVNYTRPVLKQGTYALGPDLHPGVSEAQEKVNSVARMGAGLSASITFASSIIVSVLIGLWLDKHFEPHSSTPWATVVMTVLGFAAGFITFVRISTVADHNTKRHK